MTAPPIDLMNLPGEASGWMCGECFTLHRHSHFGAETQERARVCCQKGCDWKECPELRMNHSIYCAAHAQEAAQLSELKRFKRAEKVERFEGAVYIPSLDGPQDGFFPSLEDLLNYYDGRPDRERPTYAYTTTELKPSCSADDVIEWVLENHHEDARDGIEGEVELQEFLDAWWSKQAVITWEPDYQYVILIPPAQGSPSATSS